MTSPGASTVESTDQNVIIEDGDDITLILYDLKTAGALADHLLARPREIVAKITSIEVETNELIEESDDAESNGSAPSSADDGDAVSVTSSMSQRSDAVEGEGIEEEKVVHKEMNHLCAPLIRIMNAIEASGGSLHEFVWIELDPWDDNGIRPSSFWTALYQHARTLRSLSLGFFTHEVDEVPPPEVSFPALKELEINAVTAHGDNGAAIDKLLKGSSGLESLDLKWPQCNLDSCQITNITWDFTFERLRTLSVDGWDFNPPAFLSFLARCPNVERFYDGVYTYPGDDREVGESLRLPASTFPNLKALEGAGCSPPRSLDEWFDPAASRPIERLRVGVLRSPGAEENGSAWAAHAKSLKVLKIYSNVRDWRPWKLDSEDEAEGSVQEEMRPMAKVCATFCPSSTACENW
ncbi:hypothetical protein BU26DRAFT_549972, partial [Trematosphaeria pertusa]